MLLDKQAFHEQKKKKKYQTPKKQTKITHTQKEKCKVVYSIYTEINYTWIILYLFIKHSLNTYYTPVTVPDVRSLAKSKTEKSHCPCGAYILVRASRQQTSK